MLVLGGDNVCKYKEHILKHKLVLLNELDVLKDTKHQITFFEHVGGIITKAYESSRDVVDGISQFSQS